MRSRHQLNTSFLKMKSLKGLLSLCYSGLFILSKTSGRRVFELTRHKTWLYRAKIRTFSSSHFIGDLPPVTAEDRMIAADIAHYFASLRESGVKPQPASVWDVDRMGAADLIRVLEAGDVDAIATTLTGMFHSRYIQGMEHGYRHQAELISPILVPTLIEDRMVSLAEYLGTSPAETPEQGIPALALKDGLEPVVAGLEKALGYSLAFPEDMGESGIRVGGRLLTQRLVAHVHMSVCMKQALTNFGGSRDAYRIVEIGGGYGGLCFWSFKTRRERLRHLLRVVIDGLFILGLSTMVIVCAVMVYAIA